MSAKPDPFRSLPREILKDRAASKNSRNASPFFGTGVHPNGEDGLDSDNFVTGVSGFSLNGGTGNAEFNDIILRDLPNSMLANPIVPGNAHADASNFSLSPTWATKCSVTVPVPSGFTQALILAVATGATARNTTASIDFFYASVSISAASGSLPGWVLGSPDVNPGTYGVTQDFRTVLLTGLSGSFTIDGQVNTAYGTWTADSGNKMNLDASILFLR